MSFVCEDPNVFTASTQAGVATSTALSTTQTGLTLTNPDGSGKSLVILRVKGALTSAPAGAASVVLALGTFSSTAVTQTTPLTVRRVNLGIPGTGVGLAASAVTLPAAPVVVAGLGGPVAASSLTPAPIDVKFDGEICVAEGCSLSINSLTTAVSGVWSITWKEVPAIG